MKTRIFLKLSAVMMIIALCTASCGKSPVTDDAVTDDTENSGDGGNGGDGGDGGNDNGNGDTPATEVMVSLNLVGEIPDMENRSSALLYIQAYSLRDDDDEYYEMKPYAHGLFDKASDISVPLQKDGKYKFLATIVADGKNRISMEEGVYRLPFRTSLTNSFVVNDEFNRYLVMRGDADLAGSGMFIRPDIDRYYGESPTYTVAPDNPAPATISLVRATFGLNVTVKNLTEGKLYIETEGTPRVSISYPETEVSYIFSARSTYDAYRVDCEGKTEFTNEYAERINVNITYVTANGLEIPVKQDDYWFYRNECTNLEVTVSGTAVGSGININVEDTEVKDDNQMIEFVGGGDYKKN